MALRAATLIDEDGAAPATYTPAASDTFSVNDLPAILEVRNASGGSINVTRVDGGRTTAGTAAAAISATAVANNATHRFKLTSAFADTSTGLVTVNFSGTTSVTCEFYRY